MTVRAWLGNRLRVRSGQVPEELAADVALEGADDLAAGAPLGGATGEVGGCGVVAEPGERDGVDRPVQAPVSAAVEPVPLGVARRCRQRGDPGQGGEGG